MNNFKRTVFCGNINESFINKEITLAGWVNRRRDLGGLIFIDIRDRSGIMQLVFDPATQPKLTEQAHKLRSEFVIGVKGVVIHRQGAINTKIGTGNYELKVTDLQIFNESETLPFQLDSETQVSEELRLKYRYLDLRRKQMHDFMKLRHDVVLTIRNYFNNQGFYEIETPILSKSTPEGARDFLVPSRIQHGTFYALPQSPQLYKQLLIAGGIERYFQIARCFRDEALRANRQLEFTQLDIEMSFVDEQDIQDLCEGLFKELWAKYLNYNIDLPLKRYTYNEVFAKYGNDKPDSRFELEIQNLTKLFKGVNNDIIAKIIAENGNVGCLHVQNKKFSRSEIDSWVELVTKELGGKGLITIRWKETGAIDSPIAKSLPENFFDLAKAMIPTLTQQDTLFVIAGKYEAAWTILGQLRLALGKALNLINKDEHKMFWVTDFPMFEWSEEDNKWMAKHHPFTSPEPNWENMDMADIRARAYDFVYNGEELGGGSIRIHDPITQKKVFEKIGINENDAKNKFGFLLEAQTFGYPPDAGIAFGIDRLIMFFAGTESMRDVIAFPKTNKGSCLMMETPSKVDESQLKELAINLSKQ